MNNEKRVKQGLAIAFVVALIAGGVVARAVYAENEKVPYRSSVQVPPEVSGQNERGEAEEGGQEGKEDESGNEDQSEASEQQQLIALAKITIEQSITAARANVAGTVSSASLDDEDGNLVFSVLISTPAGLHDVKVDAGNGRVLFVDTTPDGEHDDD